MTFISHAVDLHHQTAICLPVKRLESIPLRQCFINTISLRGGVNLFETKSIIKAPSGSS